MLVFTSATNNTCNNILYMDGTLTMPTLEPTQAAFLIINTVIGKAANFIRPSI